MTTTKHVLFAFNSLAGTLQRLCVHCVCVWLCVCLHAAPCSSHCCCCCYFFGTVLVQLVARSISSYLHMVLYILRLIVWLILWLAYDAALLSLIRAFIFSEIVRWMRFCTCEWASSKLSVWSNERVYNFVHPSIHPSRLCHHAHASHWIERASSETKHI